MKIVIVLIINRLYSQLEQEIKMKERQIDRERQTDRQERERKREERWGGGGEES